MGISPDKIERYLKTVGRLFYPLFLAICASVLLFKMLADNMRFDIGVFHVAYIAACSILTAAVILAGKRGLFLRIAQVVIVGTLLLTLAILIITVVGFATYTWSGEYMVSALFDVIIFTILWLHLRY